MGFDRQLMPTTVDFLQDRGLTFQGKKSSNGWLTTRCEFHDGSDSMRVNQSTGGWCCMSCGAKGGDAIGYLMQAENIEFVEACKSLGCWVEDGSKAPAKPFKPAGLNAKDALQVLAHEALICCLVAADAAHGKTINQTDADRCLQAAGRIQQICEAVA